MTTATKKNVGVFFGGISPEHEVSIISAMQAIAALDKARWQVQPVYIGKDGSWWIGPGLAIPETFTAGVETATDVHRARLTPSARNRLVLTNDERSGWFGTKLERIEIDIVLPVLHGGAGEDGSLQGLCETMGVPYAGSGPLAAALAMDKVAAKRWAASYGIPQVPFAALREAEWAGNEEIYLDALEKSPGLPAIIKPAGLGSSIGIGRAGTRDELDAAIEEAFRYDGSIVVEKAVQALRELNCSVIGASGDSEPSVLEEPLSGEALLSFRDKYMRGSGGDAGGDAGSGSKGGVTGAGSKQRAQGMASLDRKIPAPVGDEITELVRRLAVRVFDSFGCSGLVRIDFLMDGADQKVYFNEINTIPGSLAFYLWDATGLSFSALLDRILEVGLARHQSALRRVRSYDVNLLSEKDLGGLKGAKK